MSLQEKVAYLKGLAEGLEINTDTKEGKMISAIIDTLGVIADEVEDLIENALDIGEELDALSDDLADVEEFLYSDDDNDDFFDYDDDDYDDDDYDDFDDTVSYSSDDDAGVNTASNIYSNTGVNACNENCFCDACKGTDVTFDVTCPACGVEIELTEADLNDDSINCPGCDEVLEFEFDDEDDKSQQLYIITSIIKCHPEQSEGSFL